MELSNIKKKILKDETKTKVVIGGRRSGKTSLSLQYIENELDDNIFKVKTIGFFSRPTLFVKSVKLELSKKLKDKIINEDEDSIYLDNRRIIFLNENNLERFKKESIVLDSIVLEEASCFTFSFYKQNLEGFTSNRTEMLITGTPYDFNVNEDNDVMLYHAYKQYVMNESDINVWVMPTISNLLIKADDLLEIKEKKEFFDSEFNASLNFYNNTILSEMNKNN